MIVAGFGFRAAATFESLADALARAVEVHVPTAFATAEDKASALPLQELAAQYRVRILAVDAASLARQETRTQSPMALRARGTGSVAEAAALSSAGLGAKLLVGRVISGDGMATCAIAIGKEDVT